MESDSQFTHVKFKKINLGFPQMFKNTIRENPDTGETSYTLTPHDYLFFDDKGDFLGGVLDELEFSAQLQGEAVTLACIYYYHSQKPKDNLTVRCDLKGFVTFDIDDASVPEAYNFKLGSENTEEGVEGED